MVEPRERSNAVRGKLGGRKSAVIEYSIIWRVPDDHEWSIEWDDALHNMMGFERLGLGWHWTGSCNLAPLAKAIAGGSPMPETIRRYLATLLDPPPKWRGPSLKVKAPKKRTLVQAMRKIGEMWVIRQEFEALRARYPKKEALVEELMNKYGKARSEINEIVRLTDAELLSSVELTMGARIVGRK